MPIDREKLYDLIYDKADRLFKKYHPCNIHETPNGVQCKRGKLCCDGCEYIGEHGCTVRCLGCKLSFCEIDFYYCCEDLDIDALFSIKLLKLRYIAEKYYLMAYRCSKEEILEAVA